MAVIEKPQYHDKEAYPTDRPIFNRQTYGQQPSPPSNAPNVMESAASMFDSILGSMENLHVYQEQSARNRNTLHAKNLLVQKMKNDSELRTLLATELKNTPIENLDVKQIISKLKSRNRDGQTDLYVGKDLSHNISPMTIPDDTPQEVIDLIEEQWVRTDVGFAGDLMSKVTNLHTEFSNEIYENKQSAYKSKIIQDALNPSSEVPLDEDGFALITPSAKNSLENINSTAMGMVEQGVWTIPRAIQEQEENIQDYLESKYLADYIKNPEKALEKAKNGKYVYKNERGTYFLDRKYYLPSLQQDAISSQRIEKNKAEQEANDNEYATFLNNNIELQNDTKWDFQTKRDELIKDNPNISQLQIHKYLINQDLKRNKLYDQQTQEKISKISLDIVNRGEKALKQYLDNNGKIKSQTELETITGIKGFKPVYIRQFKIDLEKEKKNKDSVNQKLKSDSAAKLKLSNKQLDYKKEFLSLDRVKTFLGKYTNGNDFNIDNNKIKNDPELNELESALRWTEINGQKLTNDEILEYKKLFILPLIIDAKKKYTTLKNREDRKNEFYTPYEVDTRKRFIGEHWGLNNLRSAHNTAPGDLQRVKTKNGIRYRRINSPQRTVLPDFNEKNLENEHDLEINAVKNRTIQLLKIAENKDTYTIPELQNYIKQIEIRDPKLRNYDNQLVESIQNIFQARITALKTNTVEIGHDLTGQDKHVENTGLYNMEGEGGYFEFLKAYGLEYKEGAVLKSRFLEILEKLPDIGNRETAHNFLNIELKNEWLKYGKGTKSYRYAFEQIIRTVPKQLQSRFSRWKSLTGNIKDFTDTDIRMFIKGIK